MSEAYEEILEGEVVKRPAPGVRHEQICQRLHDCVGASAAGHAGTRLLDRRAQIILSTQNSFRPDLALVTVATGKLWLAAEVINSQDHRPDTVVKKQVYEELKIPRLWMVDPRYDNVEVYYASEYGLVLKCILAGSEVLTEKLLPAFNLSLTDLFKPA
jgi:Uma2 family endonuclease